jgi:hypothetical protein
MVTNRYNHSHCLLLAFLALLVSTGCQPNRLTSTPETADRIASILEKEIPRFQGLQQIEDVDLMGRYTRECDELADAIGGGFLSGSNLYLLPEGQYLYTEWADVEPETIYEKGTWRLEGKTILLARGASATGRSGPCDSRFVPFQLAGHKGNPPALRIIGQRCGWQEFLSDAREGDPSFALLMNSLELVQLFGNRADVQELLMRLRP